jgi:hypothetical protein
MLFNLLQSRSDIRFIDSGLVPCSSHMRDVELDVCAGCPWKLELTEGVPLPFVRCQPESLPINLSKSAGQFLG